MRFVLLIIVSLLLVPSVHAGETEWVELAPGVSTRLVSSDVDTDGEGMWMGLEIDMPSDTKTYWRVPGESGIPLAMDISGSNGIESLEWAWPFPQRETKAGYVDHAYYGRTLIPFRVALSDTAPQFDADLTLGICSDICIPASARLTLAPDLGAADGANGFRIQQALAQVPLQIEGEDILGTAWFDATTEAVVVERRDDASDPASMIAEIEGRMTVFGVPRIMADGSALSFPVLGRIRPEMLDDARMRFSFQTEDGPYEIVRDLEL